MKTVAILAVNSWQENLRSRFFGLTLAFGAIFLYVSLLLGLLAADQEVRVLTDFGLGLIELLGLAGALYGSATAILREMETKTIYLILTRPVGRGQYLLGRFTGLMLSVLVSMLLMACLHALILIAKGGPPGKAYALALLGAYLKVLITAALTTFLAIFSSSVLTALGIAVILWSLGHFLPELRFMIAWGPHPLLIAPLKALSFVIPDLQLFNLRDRLGASAPLGAWLGYACAYTGVWLALSRQLLRRKEF